MTIYNFTLFFDGPEIEEHVDVLYQARCDDAIFGVRGSQQFAEFDREAPSFGDALLDALRTLESVVPGLLVIRVEPDDLVTQSKIADRTGRSRESVRLLVEGERGAATSPTRLVGSMPTRGYGSGARLRSGWS